MVIKKRFVPIVLLLTLVLMGLILSHNTNRKMSAHIVLSHWESDKVKQVLK